jgi:hypothetical protein
MFRGRPEQFVDEYVAGITALIELVPAKLH